MKQQETQLLEIIQRAAIDDKTAMTIYKVKDGGIVNVKSLFSNDKHFKDALFPAVLTALKQHCEA